MLRVVRKPLVDAFFVLALPARCDCINRSQTAHFFEKCAEPRVWGAESPSSLPEYENPRKWVFVLQGESCAAYVVEKLFKYKPIEEMVCDHMGRRVSIIIEIKNTKN